MDIGPLGIAILAISSVGSFALGRWLSRKRRTKQAAQRQAAMQAGQSRQVRRAAARRDKD